MSKGRKLLNDVSMSELLQMRADGMTNREIADSLDVSDMTIYRIIGKQPDGLTNRGKYPRGGGSVARVAPQKQEEEIVPACLVTIKRTIELQGETAYYTVNVDQKTVKLKLEKAQGNIFDTLLLNTDQIDSLIKELSAIKRKLGSISMVEAW